MRIAAFMVVKNEEYYIGMALRSVLPYVLGVYIQNQCSTDGTVAEIEKVAVGFPIGISRDDIDTGSRERFANDYDEPKFRTMAVERCEEIFKPDWILKLDADEIYTPHFFRSLDAM